MPTKFRKLARTGSKDDSGREFRVGKIFLQYFGKIYVMGLSFHPEIRGTRASGSARFRIVHPSIVLLGQKPRK